MKIRKHIITPEYIQKTDAKSGLNRRLANYQAPAMNFILVELEGSIANPSTTLNVDSTGSNFQEYDNQEIGGNEVQLF